eukprot:s29_g39.t1
MSLGSVGLRIIPNSLVTQVGAKAELPVMLVVLLGYSMSALWGFGPDAAVAPAAAPSKDPAWAQVASKACPVLEIKGATGQFGDQWTNGRYDEMAPVYVLRGGPFERFLYFDSEHYWRVGSCEYKDQEKAAAGSMRSADPVRPGTLPTAVPSWTVRTGYDEWMLQAVTASLHISILVQDPRSHLVLAHLSETPVSKMKSFLFISLLAMAAAQDAVVEEAAPAEAPAVAPAVAPVAPPAPPVAAAAPAKHEPSGDEIMAQHRQQALATLASAGLSAKQGAWLYGDYINDVDGVTTATACAQACVADTKCYHWNFKFDSQRCDLKAENGGVNEDIADWVTGDVPRPKKNDEI